MEKKIEAPKYALEVPVQATRILLHSCCAPCSGAVIECMLENRLEPTVFYFNPNIFPQTEYERRKAENIRFVESLHLPFIDGDYDHEGWKVAVKGLENEPERGRRCLTCFRIRMAKTAQYAATEGFIVFATTLGASRWKDLEQIALAGHEAASVYPGLTFWAQNWRKGGLSDRRNELIRLHGFYNQSWCGCEYPPPERAEGGSHTVKYPPLEGAGGGSRTVKYPPLEGAGGGSYTVKYPPPERAGGGSHTVKYPPLEGAGGGSRTVN